MSDKRIVYLIDDEDSVRRAAAFMLRAAGFEVKTYSSGVEFLREAEKTELGCILLDVRMPEMDGLEVQNQLNARGIRMPIIILTGHGDINIAVAALKNGAADFLEKPFERTVLLLSIDAAFERFSHTERADAKIRQAQLHLAGLTSREREVLRGLVRGHPNKTIAFDLGISPRTVELHRANLMSKLQVRSLSDALRIAFAAGLENEPT
ncbi:response regulator transcription factor [Sphingomonas sp. OTU376]|uniref:response regulator transcription factor n=1 Tax=Sphingomonas sp. OTU376 TaxID=3043863 RepID=UPI00313E9287